MRLVTLAGGRAARLENDAYVPLPGRLVDHLCREPSGPTGDPVPAESIALQAPIARPGKVVCLGQNYAAHAAESGTDIPPAPRLFAKVSSCIIGPDAPVQMPQGDVSLDYEAELLIVIGRPGHRVSEADAETIIGGYACFNDISERKAQRGDGQWFRGKSYDTFAPFGPWVVTPDEVGDPNDLSIRSTVNGEVRQNSNTADMIFKVPEIVSYCSHAFSLEPGDVIATGTPEGVGARDGRFMSVGDTVTVEIEKLGTLTNPIIG
jgi:2-keto-4-pentenoate hydratase/2-oxohepta-3-ene-1,7-dioic acid hydratase in catechol pathway